MKEAEREREKGRTAEEERGSTKLPRLSHTEDLWNTNQAVNAFGHAGVQLLSTSRPASNFRSYRYIPDETFCKYIVVPSSLNQMYLAGF